MSSSKVFQIYFNEKTKARLSPIAIPFDNSYYPTKPFAPAFENHVIKKIFDEELYGDAERVGVLSWAFEEKNRLVISELDLDQKEDVITFHWHPGETVKIYKVFEAKHPGITGLARRVLKEAGYDIDLENIEVHPIYQNAHITKTSVYKRYVDEMLTPVMDAMFNGRDADLMAELYNNSNYRYGQEFDVAQVMLNTSRPYYTYHAFICETLPALYFALNPEITIKKIYMNNVDRYLGNIRVISLVNRPERRKEVAFWLRQHGLSFVFSDAVEDKECGALGCAKSHLKTLSGFYESASESEEYLLVMEDDCVFVPDFLDKFNSLDLSVCPEWDSLRLGCLHRNAPIRINKGLVQAVYPLDKHSVLYKVKEIPKYLAIFEECIGNYVAGKKFVSSDTHIAEQIARVNIVAAYPNLTYQREGESDIAKRVYSNYNKNATQRLFLDEIQSFNHREQYD